MNRRPLFILGGTLTTCAMLLVTSHRTLQGAIGARAAPAPRFTVNPLWPRPLPNHWLLGSATGVAIDSHDHVFVLNNPASFNARTEVGASTTPPTGNCCFPAPPVLEFDQAGNLVNSWGGAGSGFDWPTSPSGIAIDDKDNVWIGGGAPTDGQVLKFTHDGKFLMQSGKPNAAAAATGASSARGRGAADTSYGGIAPAPAPGRGGGRGPTPQSGPAVQPPGNSSSRDAFGGATRFSFDPATNEAFVADGYRNRRIAVIDMTTGAIKRSWGANGGKPDDATLAPYTADAPANQFRTPSCAATAHDGTVYVCDRGNDRIQLFGKNGTFVKQQPIASSTLGEGSVWDIAFSRDPGQKFIYVADGMNERIHVLDRATLAELTAFGDGGRYPGQFVGVNSVATDSKGNLYTTEMYEGKRVQMFTFRGVGTVSSTDQGTVRDAAATVPVAHKPVDMVPGMIFAPRFEVDPEWPKPLPNHWILGMMVGVSIDSHDHVFIIHRPRSINAVTEGGAGAKPPTAGCCIPAPPVLEFDAAGNLVNSWGGPGEGYDWPNGVGAAGEHGISVDMKGNVWLGSTGTTDRQILKFTHDGKFIAQFGKPAAGKNSLSTTDFAGVAMMSFDEQANEAYVADGYRNKRVVVIDMTTGAIKRFWGAYGHKPDDNDNTPYVPGGPPSQQFGNPVHCAMLSDDGLVYVTDRKNDRIQVFHKDGTFIKEKIIAPETLGDGSMWEIAFSGDKAQKYMYVTDGKNEKIYILDRQSLEVLTSFGDGGRQPGQFFGAHSIATDSKGNIYTTETYEGRRLQKFTYKGLAPVAKPDQGTVWPNR